ncbi:hypothetical protein D3C73_1276320 [compost metagenome]
MMLHDEFQGGDSVHLRHFHIHRNDVRFETLYLFDGFKAVAGDSHDKKIRILLEQGADRLPHKGGIIDDEHTVPTQFALPPCDKVSSK